jgi:sirohydrochlorin cobaltochelatase
MKKNIFLAIIVSVLIIALNSITLAGGHGHTKSIKKGILLVAFGSSIPEAQVLFDNIDKRVKENFPDMPVRWAFTSHIIRHKLAKEGKALDSVEMALAKMMDGGFTHIAVQSLHTIPGEEYEDLVKTANAFRQMPDGFECIVIGSPLLANNDDYMQVVTTMLNQLPEDRKKQDAVVLMGHGTPHSSNACYPALMYYFQQEDPNIFIGVVEGKPAIDEVKVTLIKKGIKKAYLIPFMSVAGDHAINDMAGSEEGSWKSVLVAEGISCIPVLKGTAEYDGIVDIWIRHLKMAMVDL